MRLPPFRGIINLRMIPSMASWARHGMSIALPLASSKCLASKGLPAARRAGLGSRGAYPVLFAEARLDSQGGTEEAEPLAEAVFQKAFEGEVEFPRPVRERDEGGRGHARLS